MKARDAQRVALLVQALADMQGLVEQSKSDEPENKHYDRRLFAVRFGDGKDTIECSSWSVVLDAKTGRMLLPFVVATILAELQAMGVEVENAAKMAALAEGVTRPPAEER